MMDYVLNFPDQLGLHIKSLRKALGMSQAKLATLLQVSQSRVAAIEKDPAAISVGQFLAILKLLDAELVIRRNARSGVERGQLAHEVTTAQEMTAPISAEDAALVDEAALAQQKDEVPATQRAFDPQQSGKELSAAAPESGIRLQPQIRESNEQSKKDDEDGSAVQRWVTVVSPKQRGLGSLTPAVVERLKKQGVLDENGNFFQRLAGSEVATPAPRRLGSLPPSIVERLKKQGVLDENGNFVQRLAGSEVATPASRRLGSLPPAMVERLKKQGVLDENGNFVQRLAGSEVATPASRRLGSLPPAMVEQLKKQGILDEEGRVAQRPVGSTVSQTVLKPQVLPVGWKYKNPKGSW